MSTMKNGFSTLNRWFGKRNKDKNVVSNGKLSKSNHNLSLSISTSNINEPNQLEYNRITPSPAATSNAPFEQTFRVTVLLPKDQLYVSRLGARVPLSKLLELVCENKLLNANKYEFRNPVDASQVFDLNLSIGAVGLSEIRLCLKTDSYDNFNTDEVIKLRCSSGKRDSCSSSEFSSRQSKITTAKTISPYSSSNSLNSLESSSVHYARVPMTPPTPVPAAAPTKVTAPPRKKRAAPRPPSQVTIHEKEPLTNGHTNPQSPSITQEESVLNKKNYYVSTPDLATSPLPADKNNSSTNGLPTADEIIDANELYARVEKKNVRNSAQYGGSVQNLSTTIRESLPEPSPRTHIIQPKSKKAPAPPSAVKSKAVNDESSVLKESPFEPIPTARNNIVETTLRKEEVITDPAVTQIVDIPKPVPRATTNSQINVSKVLLNRSPTPEPHSLSSESTDGEHTKETNCCEDDDAASKQADSGIGEPVPSPLPESLKSEGSTNEIKSTFESSSDDDEVIRVYNFKLGKTIIQPLIEHEMLQTAPTPPTTPATPATPATPETPSTTNIVEEKISANIEAKVSTTPASSETAAWNFCIPITPPANFADNQAAKQSLNMTEQRETSDTPITPKIKERPLLNFEAISVIEMNNNNNSTKIDNEDQQATTTLDEIVDELSAVIQDKGVNSLIKKPAFSQEIESAKPNTLSNFSIVSIDNSCSTTDIKEEVLRKRSSINLRINRADSFHTAKDNVTALQLSGLNSRSSSCAALANLESAATNIVARGKSSSSELSIKESPLLQSLEVMKTILNSRKNSLVNNSGSDADSTEDVKPKIEPAKELPKTYRYSGPPSINLGCWNERPKNAQVAIKNEGDYIFGGKSAQKSIPTAKPCIDVVENKEKSNTFNFSAQPKHNFQSTPTSPIKRMGIPEKDYRVPITVKPLKDFCVENYASKSDQDLKIYTLPRNKVQRNSSIKAFEAVKSQKDNERVSEVPFGQNTLRKTGLKEKILASQEETKENNSHNENTNIFAIQLKKQQQFNTTTSIPKKQVYHTNLMIPLQKSMSVQHERAITPPTPKSVPPPPPLKSFKSLNNTPKTPPCDPRDQLLDSIRNFKREKLKPSTFQK